MSVKTLANKVTSRVGKQVLTLQKHSPTMLVAVGAIGVGASVVLACRATLKLSDVLEEGESDLKKVEVTVTEDGEEVKKAGMNVRLQTAIMVAKLYALPSALLVTSIGAIACSHIILRRRNVALTAAYAIVHKSYQDYRGRVVADQGRQKDLEYAYGLVEREIVEDGPNGPEVKIVRGLDQNAVKAAEARSYSRVFDPSCQNWSEVPMQNQFFLQMVQNHANDALRANGFIFLNDVYDMLGFKRTKAGQIVGWVDKPTFDEQGNQVNDTHVDFGTWSEGMYKGKSWVNGDTRAFLLDFNVDGNVLDILETM